MVNRFFKALFAEQTRSEVPVAELVPESVLRYFPEWQGQSLANATLIYAVPAVILVAGLAWAFATYVFQLNQQGVALHVAKTYREKLFEALVTRPYLEIRRRPAGEWMSIVMNDVMFLQMRLSDLMTGLVRDSVVIVSAFVVLAVMHWPTALVLVAVAPFVALGMGRTGKRIARYSDAFQRELTRLAGMILDLRARFDLIRSQAGEDRERRRFGEASQRYYRMIRRSILVRSAFAPALEAFGFVLFAACVYAIGHGLWKGFTPELMMQFLLALGVLLKPLKELGEQLTRLGETRGVLNDSLRVFDRGQTPVRKSLGPAPGGATHQGLTHGGLTPSLRVSLAAGFDGVVKFKGEDLVLAPGKAVAVVGPSGAGKSTLIKALVGLIDPATWDANVSFDQWTRSVSMVSQEPFLFDDSVRENLLYGLPADAEPDEAAIWRALAQVNVDAEIKALPEGLATRMRAIGANVSGGQLQRLVIARALLRLKPVLILDEATSAIDTKTEQDVTKRLIAACHEDGTAMLAVTHRLTWLGLYDEVWFVEGGQRQLVGTHERLLAEPRYAAYCAAHGGGGGDG